MSLRLLPEPRRSVVRPILASECLREDLAPIEPFARVTRIAIAAAGVAVLVGAALVMRASVGRGLALVPAGAVALYAALGVDYGRRGRLALLCALGLLAVPSVAPAAAALLAAALFVRASYRAHRGVRVALGVGIGVFALAAALSFGVTVASHVAAMLMVAVAATSLLGFMGEQTTAGCTAWGALAVFSASLAVTLGAPLGLASLGLGVAALGLSTAVAVAGYVVSASNISPRASSPAAPASNDA